MRVICFRQTWGHMSSVSGFNPLADFIRNHCGGGFIDYFVPTDNIRGGLPIICGKILSKIYPAKNRTEIADSPFVTSSDEKIAHDVVRSALHYPAAMVLLMSGENQFGANIAKAPESVRSRVILTLHQPPSWLRLHWRDFSTLNGLGAIICLSKEQQAFVTSVCNTPTIFLRHGVCHDFFKPSGSLPAQESPRLLFVGQWLRDFETLADAMEQIWAKRPDVHLDCVIIRQARNHAALLKLARDPRVNWHADIPPEALRSLYQQASLLFLPMIDAAGNNAVVEALASGLPIVSSLVGGLSDYLPGGAGELCRVHDVNAHAQAVLLWLPDLERRRQASIIGREFAERELDWNLIAAGLVRTLEGGRL